MNKKFKLFCFGFGQVAQHLIKNLITNKHEFDFVATTTFKKSSNKKFFNKNYKSFFFDGDNYDPDIVSELSKSNKVLISIPPILGKDIVLKNFCDQFIDNSFQWITYLSSTNVYGNKNGDWVDENSETCPTSSGGKARLKAENSWLQLYKQHKAPVIIFRLAGIYSLKYNVINRLRNNTAKLIDKKNQFFSRIHLEDIVQALIKSMEHSWPGEIFNICDDYPCSNEEITVYAANLIKKAVPSKIKLESLEDKMISNFYKDSKKVKNNKMKKYLKIKLKYSTYKEGLSNIHNNFF